MFVVNSEKDIKNPTYKPSKEDEALLQDLQTRFSELKSHRAGLKANPYDTSPEARTLEETWDYDDYVSLPHKYYHKEMLPWMARNSRPLTFAKIDTAVAIIVSKNPEVEISARQERFESRSRLLEAIYNLTWDKGHGRQQLIKWVQGCGTYGFMVAREYHRYLTENRKELLRYNPETNQHEFQDKLTVVHDEPHLEVLPIRDCWFDNRAKPYDEDSLRDWFWIKRFDYSTFRHDFPDKSFPNAKYVLPGSQTITDKATAINESASKHSVEIICYENREDDTFIITTSDFNVLIFKGSLINHELSCIPMMWRLRNQETIYGISLPEILENDQELLDRVANMTINQIILAISGSGFYGGTGNIKDQDMILEPRLKKLRDPQNIVFPKIPMPDLTVFKAMEDIRDEADEMSGVTKSLGGEEVGKTLGEAVLNKEAGLRRLSVPLGNVEFALERHARLRLKNIQVIYSRPVSSQIIVNDLDQIVDPELYAEYQAAKSMGEANPSFIQQFPQDNVTSAVYRNQYRTERVPFKLNESGQMESVDNESYFEIVPDLISGEYDVKIRAFSTLPVSQAVDESRALETFNVVAKLPYTDIYKAEQRILKKRRENPEDWMMSEQQVMDNQQAATQGGPMSPGMGTGQGSMDTNSMAAKTGIPAQDISGNPQGGAEHIVPPGSLNQQGNGLGAQFNQAIR